MTTFQSVVGVYLCLTLTLSPVVPYQHYQQEIPNGERVPHPCKANFLWRGVGHENHLGGGARNPFGVDFKNNNYKWTKALCQLDSDGDGLTNGLELGDPNCVWTKGAVPTHMFNLSHPGICQPFDSCGGKPDFVDCDHVTFECDAMKEPDVFNFTIRRPETPVPAEETTYTCMTFEFPVDMTKEYHIVADKPFIDNTDVMHHILVFGCKDEGIPPFNQPFICGMNAGCEDIIGIWAVGIAGECFNTKSGFRIGGPKGYKNGVLQYHWNNPAKIPNYKDSSGMTFYVTPKLRPYDAGVLMVGERVLTIPPGEQRHVETGACKSECTEFFMKEEMKIISVFNHMHYLGIAQDTQIIRKDTRTTVPIGVDKDYSYDNPKIHHFETGIALKPGDELKTTCVFKSTSRTETTYYGDGTNQEMCYTFITFYPKEAFPQQSCLTFGDEITTCDFMDDGIVGGCKVRDRWNISHPDTSYLIFNVNDKCSPNECREGCREFARVVKQKPCFSGPYDEYLRYEAKAYNDEEALHIYGALDSCDEPNDDCNHFPISYTCALAPGDFNLRCIPIAQRCDGHYDCPFGDDEDQCGDGSGQGCSDEEVCCLDGNCASVCNGSPQCANEADESQCPASISITERCPSGMIQCPSGACATMCDGVVECNSYLDCEDDEAHCRTQCPAEQVVCNTPGLCGIPCSNEEDCPDKVDEQNCYIECGTDEIACLDEGDDAYCAPLCDGIAECGWDENDNFCGDECDDSANGCVKEVN